MDRTSYAIGWLHFEFLYNYYSYFVLVKSKYCTVNSSHEEAYLIGKNLVGKKISRQKKLVGKKFGHLPKIWSLFSDQMFLPTKVFSFYFWCTPINFRFG